MTTVSTDSTRGPYWIGCTVRRWATRSSNSSTATERSAAIARWTSASSTVSRRTVRWARTSGPSMRTTAKYWAMAAISRWKSSALNRPSPSRSGKEFEVVATRSRPPARTRRRNVTVMSVLATSSSSNSSRHTKRWSAKAATAASIPTKPMRAVSSAKVR